MSILDRIKSILNIKRPISKPDSSTEYAVSINTNIVSPPDFGGSRTTLPKFAQGGNTPFGALPRRTQRELSLDERKFTSTTLFDLVDILIDAHPDVSFALWNFLRIGNTGFNVRVYKLGTEKRWTQAEKDITEFLSRLKSPAGDKFEKSKDIKKTVNQLILSVITRGAAACELVVTDNIDDVAFIAPVDPGTIQFMYENDRYVPYQDAGKLSLNIPTFFYEGLDEKIDDPYGRSPIISALTMVLFQLQVLNDLKAVVHNQGYPKIDVNIIEEVLLKRMPIHIRNNEEKKNLWIKDRMAEIISMYSDLEPDDAMVHFDSVEVGMVGGDSGGKAMMDPQKLMSVIDNLVMTGLKTLSTIMGRRASGNTESFAKLEIKLYLQGIKEIQEVVAKVLSRALTLYLNIRGKQGIVEVEFNAVEIRTDLEQQQMEIIRLQNIAYMRDQGWIDQDEASDKAVGHAPVGEPNYDALGGSSSVKNKDGGAVQPTPDTNPAAGGNTDVSGGS